MRPPVSDSVMLLLAMLVAKSKSDPLFKIERVQRRHRNQSRRFIPPQRSSTESRPRWTPTSVETLRMASRAPSTYGRALFPES